MFNILSVSEVNKLIKDMFSREPTFTYMLIKGEISNFKLHFSGHAYFTLKDEKSVLKCVMFKSNFDRLNFSPVNGTKVIANGRISVYERDGAYQLYIEELHPEGFGELHIAFEQLKQKLNNEGLFDKKLKKNLPFLPRRIGVITSSTGAVIKDIISVASKRFYNVEIKLFPVKVQGPQAADQIAEALKLANTYGHLDVIIVARGGGSIEELWPFNEEIVARAIFTSTIPVVSAVGHETDYTISDLVADVRAATPSAAAEIILPEKRALADGIKNCQMRLNSAINSKVANEKTKLTSIKNRTVFTYPYEIVNEKRIDIDNIYNNIIKSLRSIITISRSRLEGLSGKLNALSPLSILERGYSIALTSDLEKCVRSINDVMIGDRIDLITHDGKLQCRVEKKGGI